MIQMTIIDDDDDDDDDDEEIDNSDFTYPRVKNIVIATGKMFSDMNEI